VADVIAGLQFAVDFRSDYNIRVVNLSLRSSHAESYLTDPLDAAVEQAWFAGIVVVAAAGNGGTASDAVSYAPGNDPHILTVGAVDDLGTKDTSDDRLTAWSSRGTTQDGVEKPEVVAPGARLVSTLAPDSYYASSCSACVVDGSYLRIGGTSMAAAVISGEVADLLQAYPSWTPDKLKATVVRRTRAVYAAADATLVDGGGDATSATSTTDTIVGGEAAADKAVNNPSSYVWPSSAPNTLLDASTFTIDYDRLGWSRLSWSTAPDALRASWSRLSWSAAEFSRLSWSATSQSCADLDRAGWTRLSWSDADIQSAKDACLALDPTAEWASAPGVETTRLSWSSSFDR
jgi:serine protease AprX